MKATGTPARSPAVWRSSLRVSMVLGGILAYGIGLWMVLLRHFQGGHNHGGPSLLVHWLGDASVALPGVVVAMVVAVAFAARKLTPRGGTTPLARQAILAGVAAPAASLAYAASFPLRALLFGASESEALPPPVRIARDTLLGLAIALPLAALGASLVLSDRRSARGWRFSRSRTILLAGSAAVLAAASLGGSVRAADPGPGTPCPAAAPVKTFDVHAIDVDITLNRFGDHDPTGKMYVLGSRIADVRAEETAPLPNRVSIGLREDAIQPLVIRANEGDCVEITFTNNASGGPFGVHLDGLSFDTGSSGDAVGQNFPSDVALGNSRTYRYYVPNSPAAEGAHYMRPGPGNRAAVEHGLFGVLAVEPPGSSYLNMSTGAPLDSGWEASIIPGNAKPSFREFVQVYHEVGDENFLISTKDGGFVPLVDPITTSYRPDSRAINYRSEAFMNRLQANDLQESQGYGSYTFGDPATPMMRGYLKDPTKIRLVHGGGEMFHVFHLHGGGDRWRANPLADKTYDYSDTGLNKHPKTQSSPSTRLDSQAFGPGESYNLEIEGGAGAVQQGAGDFLYHCHIAEHYISGMWSFWRVYDTKQPDLAPLPDRVAPPDAVDSSQLIGKTINGMTITAGNLNSWISQQLPPQGVQKSDQDASVWNWTTDPANPNVYLGEPEDKGPWPDLPNIDPSHPGSLITDLAPGNIVSTPSGDRPKIMFDPTNGRPAFPLMRPHIGHRPPFSPNGHSGAPWLGENGGTAVPTTGVDPYANRADGICPADATTTRHFNVVAITLPIQNTKTKTDPTGMIYTLAHDKDAVYAGTKPAQPLAIRSNIGDCDAVTLTSEETDATQASGFAKVNMHIHHVQFDTQASDGVITGMSFEQSVRPYKAEDPVLTAAAAMGDTTLALSSVTKFEHTCADGATCDNVWIGVGLGTEAIEVRQIQSIDPVANTVTLTKPLGNDHPVGDAAGTEFTQYRWYPDVLLDNIFWHDHVDGIHNWGHGLVGQLIIEPAGSTYHDPKTGDVVDSGTIVDIHTTNPLISGVVDGSYREMVLWTIDENPNTNATLNLKAEPWADRLAENPDQSLLFSSYTHGDPITPLPQAYPGDPFVIRTINVGPTVDGLHIDGHRFRLENRYFDSGGNQEGGLLDTLKYGISEKATLVLQGGAGGPQHQPGDYLYENSIDRKFRDGAWGLIRVLPAQSPDLLQLPGTPTPPVATTPPPTQTGGRPPNNIGVSGAPCPPAAPVKNFTVSAVDVLLSNGVKGPLGAFVNGSPASPITFKPDPLVLHVAAGDCVVVAFTNKRTVRSSFHVGMLLHSPDSSGVDAGYNSEQTVATGQSRTYTYYADGDKYETGVISDYGTATTVLDPQNSEAPAAANPSRDGLYGAIDVAPAGATFTDAALGSTINVGPIVDVHLPGRTGYRDFTVMLGDSDERIGQNEMPYPTDVRGDATINYRTAGPRIDGPSMFSSAANGGDPETPLLRSYPGDPIRVHAISAPGSEQQHSFSLGGLSWPGDPGIPESDLFEAQGVVPMGVVDAHVDNGAPFAGDYFYGDLRRPFTVAGMWGLQRVLNSTGCPIRGLDGRVCGTPLPAPTVTMTAPAVGSVVSGTAVPVSADASDPVGIQNVQFQLDGVNIGSPVTTAPYSISWNSKLASDGPHVLAAVATNNNGVSSTAAIPVVVDNTAPLVDITAPLAGSTVVGKTVALAADASDNNALAGVQFKVDGSPVGAEDTSAPYSATWDSTAVADGTHTVTAVARDLGGNTTTASVTVKVGNTPPPPPAYVFGIQTVQLTKATSNAGVATAFKTTTPTAGSVTQLRVYVDGPTAGSLVVGLYSNSASGHPGTRLTTGTLLAPVAGQFNTVTVPAVNVAVGETYWIAILGPSGTLRFRDQGSVAGSSEVSAVTGLAGLPGTWTSGKSSTAGGLSAYAAGTPTPPMVLIGNANTEAKIDSGTAGQAEAFRSTASTTGSMTQLRVYVDAGSTAGTVVVGLYSNTAGHPGTLLASGTITAPAAGQNTVSVSPTAVTAGTTYWIAVLGRSGTLKFRDRGQMGNGSSEKSQQTTLTALPATWTSGKSFSDGLLSAVGIG